MKLLATILIFVAAMAGAEELPPAPQGAPLRAIAAVVVPPATNVYTSLVTLKVMMVTPSLQIIEVYCVTNCPKNWIIERSTDLTKWETNSSWITQSNAPRQLVPKLRDNARLIDWFLDDRPKVQRFYRVKFLQ